MSQAHEICLEKHPQRPMLNPLPVWGIEESLPRPLLWVFSAVASNIRTNTPRWASTECHWMGLHFVS